MTKSPSALARNAMVAKLADPTLGFNATYANVVLNYPGAGTININFTPTTISLNFFMGRVSIEEIVGTGNFTWPLMNVYATAGASGGSQKSVTFDGLVTAYVCLHISSQAYEASALQANFEVWCDAAEDALMQVVNNLSNQNWGPYVTYNGKFGFERSDILKAGTNWLQSLYFKLTFQVTVP